MPHVGRERAPYREAREVVSSDSGKVWRTGASTDHQPARRHREWYTASRADRGDGLPPWCAGAAAAERLLSRGVDAARDHALLAARRDRDLLPATLARRP